MGESISVSKMKIPDITRVNAGNSKNMFSFSFPRDHVLCNSKYYVAITSLPSSVPAPAKDIEAVFHPNGETSQTLIHMMRPEPKHHPES